MTEEIDGDSNPQGAPEPDPRAKSPDGTWAFQGGVEQTPVPGTDPREDPNPPAPTRNAPASGPSANHPTKDTTEKPSSGGTTDLSGPTKPLTAWNPGDTVFGQFRLIERLGAGGMGEVWLVHKIGLERRSALKVIKPEIAQSEDGWGRFEREAQVMAKFNHPNVVTIFDYKHTDPLAYIEMEHVHGRDLQKELKERDCRPSSLEWTAQILDQLCSVLQEAHGYIDETDGKPKPIIHRDIKPSNLMFVDKNPAGQNLKVLDFGIAKMIRDDMSVDGTIGFLGTVAYASPEQIQGMESAQGKGSRIDGRSDLYSVGVLLYQLLTGRLPFTGSPLTVASAHLREKPPSMKKVNPGANVPPEVERVVMKCLKKDPAMRYQTAHELADAFRRAIPRPVDPVWVDYPIWRLIGASALIIAVIIFLLLPSWLRQKTSGSVGTPPAEHSPTETQASADTGVANNAPARLMRD